MFIAQNWRLLFSALYLYISMRELAITSRHSSSILFSRPSSVVTRPATTRFIGQRPDTGVGAWNIESPPPPSPLSRRECPRRRRARGALLFLDFHIFTFHHSAVANIPRDPPAILCTAQADLGKCQVNDWQSKVQKVGYIRKERFY